MSFEEKNTWVYLALAIVLPSVYGVIVFGQLGAKAVTEIDYAGPLLAAIVAAILLAIVGATIISIGSPTTAGQKDERDVGIARRSELAGYYVLAASIVGVLMLVVNRTEYFWIANAIYASFVLSAIVSSIVKLAAYRRGF